MIKLLDDVYEIFILNGWIIPFICLTYGLVIKYYLKHKGISNIIYLTPIFCVVISCVIFLTIPNIDRAPWGIVREISDILYNGLAAVGIYELIKSTRKFILIHILKKQISENSTNGK